MSHALIRVAAAASMLLVGASASGQGLALTHSGTIYADQAGVKLKSPEGVACGAKGAVAISDTGNGRLVTFAVADGTVTGVKEVKLAELTSPARLRFTSDGGLLVLDLRKKRIARVDASGKFGGYVDVPGVSPGNVLVGSFALDGAGNLYVQDLVGDRVVGLDATGKVIRELRLPSEKEAIFVDLTADAGGTLYAVDARGAMVWTAAKDATSFKPLTKSLKDVLSFPAFVTVNKGRIYVVDQNGNGLVVLGPDGAFLGRRLSIGWNEGLVRYPSQLCISDGGEAYLADRQNNRVQVFSMK